MAKYKNLIKNFKKLKITITLRKKIIKPFFLDLSLILKDNISMSITIWYNYALSDFLRN